MDVYITDTPLFKNLYDDLTIIRSKSKIWNMPSKIDITLYTLWSYALYKWSNILIKYDLEDKSKYDYFEQEVRKIFPNAILIRGRSDNQKKFQDSIKLLQSMDDPWIFYSGNNDHPFVFSDLSVLDQILEKAKNVSQKHKKVSVFCSHLLEAASILSKDSNFGIILNQNRFVKNEIIEEDEFAFVTKRKSNSFFPALQIVHIDLFNEWFSDPKLAGKQIRRSDDLTTLTHVSDHVLILPKKQICEHFDGYGNLNSIVGFSVDDVVPPLFLPPGFFDHDIKIAYGFDSYREGWVNINPNKKFYSFSDSKNGTDMKIGLSNLPLFWKDRISKTDIAPNIDFELTEKTGAYNYLKICDPWSKSIIIALFVKYFVSPIWRISKFVHRTKIYLKDPAYLKETLNSGSQLFVFYKKSLLAFMRFFKITN